MRLSGTDSISTNLYPHSISYEYSDRGDLDTRMAHHGRELICHNPRSGLSHSSTERGHHSHTALYHYLYRHCDRAGWHADMFRDDNRDHATACADLYPHCVTDEREFRVYYDARVDDDEWTGIFDK